MASRKNTYVRDPERYFDSPADVLRCSDLGSDEKLAVLVGWKNDLLEELHATEENMDREAASAVASSSESLAQVLAAISTLEAEPNR